MSNANRPEIKGKVVEIKPLWTNNSGTFQKREVIVETGFRFPNPLKVAFQRENIALVEGITEGDEVRIPYALNGRRWDGPNGAQYYVDIVGLGLEKVGGVEADTPFEATPATTTAAATSGTAKQVFGADMTAAVNAWKAKHGDDTKAFAAFCKNLKGAKSSKDYTLTDWADVVNAINNEAPASAAAEGEEDLPF